ncbi:PucR family transcriptional regulator [Streptomyces justiciae]|uniref:PucR family transcriptional regulator n=1 Tax=Streptomyces justiciae TaxID=2780140 RepID=UPI0021196A5A|nr:PucR family transcriptional regulator [Streptomyces justiciae]MCW8378706.1 helix-turn-helix domain-containing protein [Streptomyces justiciae]
MWCVEIAKIIAERVAEQEPDLVRGDDQLQILRLGTESGVLQILTVLVSAAPAAVAPVPEGALVGDRLWARRGIPMEMVWRAIRLGHSVVAEHLLREVEQSNCITDELVRVEEMTRVSRCLFDYIDHFSSSMAAEYKAELDRWTGGGAARRLATVEGVLDGQWRDVHEVSAVLGYDVRSAHVAFIVKAADYRLAGAVDLLRLGSRLAGTAGAEACLAVEPDPVTMWGWTTRLPNPDEPSIPPGIRVSIGSRAVGVDGFRVSHLQARHADRLSALSGTSLTRYADVEVAALSTGDVELARGFVGRELGRLGDADAAVLRATLLAYLEADRSVTQAARALCVSKNTVTYRIRKAEALAGRSVRERGFELLLALRIVASVGDTILTPGGA